MTWAVRDDAGQSYGDVVRSGPPGTGHLVDGTPGCQPAATRTPGTRQRRRRRRSVGCRRPSKRHPAPRPAANTRSGTLPGQACRRRTHTTAPRHPPRRTGPTPRTRPQVKARVTHHRDGDTGQAQRPQDFRGTGARLPGGGIDRQVIERTAEALREPLGAGRGIQAHPHVPMTGHVQIAALGQFCWGPGGSKHLVPDMAGGLRLGRHAEPLGSHAHQRAVSAAEPDQGVAGVEEDRSDGHVSRARSGSASSPPAGRCRRAHRSPTRAGALQCSAQLLGTECSPRRGERPGVGVVGDTGLEPVTSSVSGKRATRLRQSPRGRAFRALRGGDGI